ncbi:MAG: ATP-binding protein [Candidatus Acidiferrales bacterium]
MRNRILWKLGGTFLLLIALVLLAVDIFVVRAMRDDALRAGFDQLQTLARLAQATPPAADAQALREWTARMSRSGARVTLIAADGAVLADSARDPQQLESHAGRPEIEEAFAQGSGRAVRHSDSVGRDLLYLAVRQSLPGRESPVVMRFSLPLARVDEAVADLRRRLWGASLVILLIAGAAALLFSRSLAARIQRLEQFARRVAHGDFRPLPVEREGDEITRLGRALNETTARLEQTIGSLTEERNRSAAILRSMVEGVAVIAPDGRVIFLNEAFRRNLGVDAKRAEDRPLLEAVRHSELVGAVQKALAGESVEYAEVALGAAGAQRHFAVTAGPVRAGDGDSASVAPGERRYGAVLVLHDISELRRLERARRDFVANVSHEFKTPLTAIQGFAETLLGGALDDAANRVRFLEIIREHAMRLARLTDDLLKLSSIEAGKLDLELREVNVADLIESCAETGRFRAADKRIAIEVAYPDDPRSLRVRGDARRLAEILQNLLDNAVQYTPEGGHITVRASGTGFQPARAEASQPRPDAAAARSLESACTIPWVRISVADTGIGIPHDQQHRIFERFYRVDAARSREVGGTGLGLAIARHLAEAHGGHIDLESEVGRGSTFTLVLPAS